MDWTSFNPFASAAPTDGNPAAGGNPADLTSAEKMGSYSQLATKFLGDMFAEKAAIAEKKKKDQYKNADLYTQFQANLPTLANTRQTLGTRTGIASALAGMY